MKKILIAHQSTIPHYRVAFYNELEKLRPPNWEFDVVFDPNFNNNINTFENSDWDSVLNFPVLNVKTYSLEVSNKTICYQTYLTSALNYDVLILENAINNLSYPVSHAFKYLGKKIIYWGHGKDRNISTPNRLKKIVEAFKISLVRNADGFLAYSDDVKSYLISKGVHEGKIFVLNNTIDILEQRKYFESCYPFREEFRDKFGLSNKQVLLFVGRLIKNKKLDFLLDAFSIMKREIPDVHLMLVGGGNSEATNVDLEGITYMGSIPDQELAKVYVSSDLYVFPGLVGLGPLQALCYDLPVITIDTDVHKPEFEYLTFENSIILPIGASPFDYANQIITLFKERERIDFLRKNTWNSIKHLTIENMARNFIHGIDSVLNLPE